MTDQVKESAAAPTSEMDFSRVLDEALNAVMTVKSAASDLATRAISADRAELFQSARSLESRVLEATPYLDNLLLVVRRAKHHTIESAYREILGKPGRESDAEKLRLIMGEVSEIQTIINAANQNVTSFLKLLSSSTRLANAGSGDLPPERNLLGKA